MVELEVGPWTTPEIQSKAYYPTCSTTRIPVYMCIALMDFPALFVRVGIINQNRKTEPKEPESKTKESESKKTVPYSVPNFEEPK
jgi:hypothetical protein